MSISSDLRIGAPGPPERRCPNCGAEKLGEYCQGCGQRHGSHLLPIRVVVTDALDDLLSLDNRVFRTLRVLLARPGKLTTDYLAGRRARYVPPFRLYLIMSVVYFSTLALAGSRSFFFFQPSAGEQAARFFRLLPRLMIVILPAFALLVQLLHLRRSRLYAEHLVFSLHYHAFAFLALSAHALLEAWLIRTEQSPWLVPAVIADVLLQLWVFAYLFVALRRVYVQSRAAAALRLVLLMAGYLGVLIGIGAGIIQLGRVLG